MNGEIVPLFLRPFELIGCLLEEEKEVKFTVALYIYRIDTSNPEVVERNYELKQQAIKLSWINITDFFLNRGKKARFKYWAKDVDQSNAGYSGYGIKKLIELDTNHVKEKAEDNLILLTVILNDGIKGFIIKSMQEDHIPNSPFFHFDILNENDVSIYTSQDFGDNLLLHLTESDLERLTKQHIVKSKLISLPEKIDDILYE